MKRVMVTILILLVFSGSTAFGATYLQSINVSPNTATVMVNEKKVNADNFNYKGTIYVPLRAISENMKATVSWDQATKTASIKSDDALKLTLDTTEAKTALANANAYLHLYLGADYILDVQQMITNVLSNSYLGNSDFQGIQDVCNDYYNLVKNDSVLTSPYISDSNIVASKDQIITRLWELTNMLEILKVATLDSNFRLEGVKVMSDDTLKVAETRAQYLLQYTDYINLTSLYFY